MAQNAIPPITLTDTIIKSFILSSIIWLNHLALLQIQRVYMGHKLYMFPFPRHTPNKLHY